MNPLPKLPERLKHAALPVLFLAFLFLPLLDGVLGFVPEVRVDEKRRLAPLPDAPLDRESLEAFPSAFETYYNDHFAFRGLLTKLHSHVMVRWLGISPTKKVLLGKEGWLFLGSVEERSSYQRLVRLDEGQCAEWTRSLGLVRRWLQERGIPFLVLVAPDKSGIYREYMPPWMRRSAAPSLFDQFLACAREAQVPVVDVRKVLEERKGERQLYYRTDTHWNNAGAYFAYREASRLLSSLFPRITPLEFSSLRLGREGRYRGDLAAMIGLDSLDEPVSPVRLKAGERARLVEGRGKMPHRLVMETDRDELPSLLLLRDSFAGPLIPFLAHDFRRLTAIWDGRFDARVVEETRPDVVMLEVVERNLAMGPSLIGESRDLLNALYGIRLASNLPRRVGRNVEEEDSTWGVVRAAAPGETPPGWLMFGPYETLQPGQYRVTFRLRSAAAAGEEVARIEVSAKKGREVLAKRVLVGADFAPDLEWTEIALPGTVREGEGEGDGVEYRVEYIGTAGMAVDSVRVRRSVPGEAAGRSSGAPVAGPR